MKTLSLRAHDDVAAFASSRSRRRNPRRRRQRRLRGTEASSAKSKEEEVVIKVFLALRPLDGFPKNAFAYPRQLLHHATVLEMTATSRDDYDDREEEEEEEQQQQRLQYLVDFAPKNPLALETAFKLLVLRTSVEGVIRHEIVEEKCARRYASSSGMDLIGEVKRKSVLEAVARANAASINSSSNSGSGDSANDNRLSYEAVDRVVEAEFYSLYDWQNLVLCKNDCRDFHRAFVRYLGEEE
jgi:hypothetical protein